VVLADPEADPKTGEEWKRTSDGKSMFPKLKQIMDARRWNGDEGKASCQVKLTPSPKQHREAESKIRGIDVAPQFHCRASLERIQPTLRKNKIKNLPPHNFIM
jgi:hypothetical protein